jgi:hypothetical protein
MKKPSMLRQILKGDIFEEKRSICFIMFGPSTLEKESKKSPALL